EAEADAARVKLQQEKQKKLQDEAAKAAPPGTPPPVVPPPEVALAEVPLQPAELKAREQYQALITGFPDLPLATDARFELAELLTHRGQFDPAVKLLTEALDRKPAAEVVDRVHLCLGAGYAAKGEPARALAEFDQAAKGL